MENHQDLQNTSKAANPCNSISSLLNHQNHLNGMESPPNPVNRTDEKALRACDVCNRRKVKCDRLLPTCSSCKEKHLDCEYTRKPQQPGPKRGYIQDLQSKVKELEKELSVKNVVHTTQYHNPNPIHLTNLTMNSIPSPTYDLLKVFFHHVYSYLPLFHARSFLEHWETQEPMVLYAMCALACKYNRNPKAEEYYKLCKAQVMENLGNPSVAAIQTLLMLTVYGSFCVNNGEPWLFAGSAYRMVNMMRLNEPPPPELTLIEQQIRNRLWWHCYLYDCYTSGLGVGLPNQIMNLQVMIPLPMDEVSWETFSRHQNPEASYYKHLTGIARLYGLVGAFNVKESKIMRPEVREHYMLDSALRTWFMALPPSIASPIDTYSHCWTAEAPHWSIAFMQMLYHTAIIILNQSRMISTLTRHPQAAQSCSFTMGVYAAAYSIANITKVIYHSNPNFYYMDPFSVHCRYLAGESLKTIIKYCPDSSMMHTCLASLDDILKSFSLEIEYNSIALSYVDRLKGRDVQSSILFYI